MVNGVNCYNRSCISRYDLGHFTVIGVLICIGLPKFIQIGPPTAEI